MHPLCNSIVFLEDLDGANNNNREDSEGGENEAKQCEGCMRTVPKCNCYPHYICPPKPIKHVPDIYTSIAALQHRPGVCDVGHGLVFKVYFVIGKGCPKAAYVFIAL